MPVTCFGIRPCDRDQLRGIGVIAIKDSVCPESYSMDMSNNNGKIKNGNTEAVNSSKGVGMKKGPVGNVVKMVLGALVFMLFVGCAGSRQTSQMDMDMRLIKAAELGHTEELKQLIRRGANINAMDPQGWTPYLAASSMGRLDAMRILKSLGCKTTTYLEQGAVAAR